MIAEGKLAIVIANHNGYEDTKECLESLSRSGFQDFFVVLVDDCSINEEDQNLESLDRAEFTTLYFRTPHNLGFAGANNLGIKEALRYSPAYVLLLNNDTTVSETALQELWDSAKDKLIQTPKILNYHDPKKVWAIGTVWDSKEMVSRNGHAGEKDGFLSGEKISCKGVSFCCAMLPAAAFSEIGFLDESYYMYHEDVDYCFRAEKLGYRFICNTAASILHKDGRSGIGISPKGLYLGLRNGCYIRDAYVPGGRQFNQRLWSVVNCKKKMKTRLSRGGKAQDAELMALYAGLNAWKHQEKGKSFDYFQPVEIYVCQTSYHVLITLIKAMKSQNPVRLILCTGGTLPEEVIERIQNSGIFDEILLALDLDLFNREIDYSAPAFVKHKNMQRQLDAVVPWKHQDNYEYYLFNDVSVMGKWLNSHKIYYHLMEDACDTFKMPAFRALNYQESKLRRFINRRLGLGFYCYGESLYYKSIEVNSLDGILLQSKKLKVLSKAELFQSLTAEEKKKLVDIYLSKQEQQSMQLELEKVSGRKMSLLLTQPWADDKIMSEKMHQEFVQDIVKQYAKYPLIIKPHPRDRQDYRKLFPNALVLNQPYVPAEVLGFIPSLQVEQAITHYSTSIYGISFAKEKIFLGIEYMTPYLKRDTDFVQIHQFAKDLMEKADEEGK